MKLVPPNFGYVEEKIFRCGSPEPRHFSFLSSLCLKTCILLTDTYDEAFVRWLQENNVLTLSPLNVSGAAGGGMEAKVDQPYVVSTDSAAPTNPSFVEDGTATATATADTAGHFPDEKLMRGLSSGNSLVSKAEEADRSEASRFSNVARFLQENTTDRTAQACSPLSLIGQVFSVSKSNYSCGQSYRHRGVMTLSEPVVVGILHLLLEPKYYPLLITCPMGRYRTGIVCGCLRKIQGWNLFAILEEYRRFAGNKSRAENEEFIELFDKDLVSLELEGGRRPTILYQI